jgi:hypothetical protein
MTKNPQGEVDSWAMDADAALPVSDYDLHSNPDAGAWAKCFIETWGKVHPDWPVPDEDWIQGWFANAMMAMYDHCSRILRSGVEEAVRDVDEAVRGSKVTPIGTLMTGMPTAAARTEGAEGVNDTRRQGAQKLFYLIRDLRERHASEAVVFAELDALEQWLQSAMKDGIPAPISR